LLVSITRTVKRANKGNNMSKRLAPNMMSAVRFKDCLGELPIVEDDDTEVCSNVRVLIALLGKLTLRCKVRRPSQLQADGGQKLREMSQALALDPFKEVRDWFESNSSHSPFPRVRRTQLPSFKL